MSAPASGAAPLVSVLLPTFERAGLVGEAVASVLAQTCTDFELLVIDDGSTDDTAAVVRGFIDPRVSYLERKHGGIAAALNTGLAQARGRLIARIDSDDRWLPD